MASGNRVLTNVWDSANTLLKVALQAGSSIVGKVGIDQTTPGTTNKVSVGNPQTVYNATGSAAIALSTTMAKAFRLLRLTIHFNAAPTTSENVTLTLNANDGAAYDTVLYKADPATLAATDLVFTPDGDLSFESGDELDLAFTNTDTKTYGVTVLVVAV